MGKKLISYPNLLVKVLLDKCGDMGLYLAYLMYTFANLRTNESNLFWNTCMINNFIPEQKFYKKWKENIKNLFR